MKKLKSIFLSAVIISGCAELENLGFNGEEIIKLEGAYTWEDFLNKKIFTDNKSFILGHNFELRIKYYEYMDVKLPPINIEKGARIIIERRPRSKTNNPQYSCRGGAYYVKKIIP